MEIFIENKQVKFTQGVQTFSLSYEGSKKELKWMSEQLGTAFKNLMHEVEIKAYKHGISDLLSNSDGLDMNCQADKLIANAETADNLKLAKEAFAKSQDQRSKAILNTIDALEEFSNTLNELKKQKAMEINGETQLKDLIPEGYEPSGTSGMSLCRGEEHITVSIKKKEVIDFKWYVDKYLDASAGSTNEEHRNWLDNYDIQTMVKKLKNKQYNHVHFEFKIGLLKFICDYIGLPLKLYLSGEYAESPKYGIEISKLKSVCPPEFLNSIFN